MLLVFDTSVLIALEREDSTVMKRLRELSRIYKGAPQITFVTYYEFGYGLQKKLPKNKEKALEFLRVFNCLPATQKTAEILATLRYTYEKKGVKASLADLIIASQVIEHNFVLVTRDKDFKKIEGMRCILL